MNIITNSILLSIAIFTVGILLFYQYLGWCASMQSSYQMYKFLPISVSSDTTAQLDRWKYFILPEYLSDTFKVIRFNIVFLWYKLTL